jgi:hypothetical protein
MNVYQKHPPRKVRDPAYRRAFQRIEESLARASERNKAQLDLEQNLKIDLLRFRLFGRRPD